MEFKNKKILLVCKESFSYPLYFLGNRWRDYNEIAAFFFNPVECVFRKCYLNDTTYYWFKDNGYKVYDSYQIALEYEKLRSDVIDDPNYVEMIEKEYTHYCNLNLQILFSQYFTRHYHFRNYMTYCTHEQQVNWTVLNYKNIISIIDDFEPDVIIDCDNAELARIILLEVAHKKGIPYITIDYPRYEMYKTYSYQLGIGIDDYFSKKYYAELKTVTKCKDKYDYEFTYIENYRRKMMIMPSEFKNTITSKYEADSIWKIIKHLYSIFRYFYNQDITAKNRKVKKKNKILFNDSWEYFKFYWRVDWNRRKYLRANPLFENPVKGEKYVYMPLHLIPESTTFVKAPFYINELSIIEAVSKALPATWKLYVKEHQAMLGERSIEFYRKVKKIPNVRLVQINYYKDPKPWIVNSQGVITITGSSAYESALLGKKSIVFGDVMFGVIEGVSKVKSLEQLPNLIKDLGSIDNQTSCAAYISAVKKVGFSINLKYLMMEGERIIRGISKMSKKYEVELDNLEKLYIEAFENWECNHN